MDNIINENLWKELSVFRNGMNKDIFRDHILAFLFLYYLSHNYEKVAKKELGQDYIDYNIFDDNNRIPLSVWYDTNSEEVYKFENQMFRKINYIIKPEYLWSNILYMAKTQDEGFLDILNKSISNVLDKSFQGAFSGLFSKINLDSMEFGNNYQTRNIRLSEIIISIDEGLSEFSYDLYNLYDAYEYIIGQFSNMAIRKLGEFYTPRCISDIISAIVVSGIHKKTNNILDFVCGSGSLLLNVRKSVMNAVGNVGMVYGQEKNIKIYNICRMNMLMHGMKDSEFNIYNGDALINNWDIFRNQNPLEKPLFDIIIANPPFSNNWNPNDISREDMRFNGYEIAPKSTADFAFLLHGLHYLNDNGIMAVVLTYGALFRGGKEAIIRKKLIDNGNIDAIIGLPSGLFYSTGVPVCIIVLSKYKKSENVLFINAKDYFEKGRLQKHMNKEHICKIADTYKNRKEEDHYSIKVEINKIIENEYNLNISQYIN